MYTSNLKKRYLGRNHLIKQLQANRLLDDEDTNSEVMNECLQKIIPLFGIKSILNLIIANAKEPKLQPICDIIIRQKRKYKDEHAAKSEVKNTLNETDLFSSLSKESVCNILDYLDKWSIEKLKTISRQFGIVCLEQMSKIKISMFNMNYLMECEDTEEPLKLNTIYNDKMNHIRYNANMRFSAIYQEWERKYNIPECYQLIFNNLGNPTPNNGIASALLFDAQRAATQKIKNSSYLLVDKRNVICFHGNEQKKLTQLENVSNLNLNKLLVLEYFDVINQTLRTKQFILYNGDVDIAKMSTYIQDKFISINDINNSWQSELGAMDNSVSKLIFYKHGPMGGLSKCRQSGPVHCMRLTFELNTKQKVIKQKINQSKIEYHQNMIPFASDTKEFYYVHQKRTIYVNAVTNKSLFQNNGRFMIRIQTATYPIALQTKVAKLLNEHNSALGTGGCIDPKNIALLRRSYDFDTGKYAYNTTVDPTQSIINNPYDHNYELLMFDATLYTLSVAINIFKPSECPHPVYNRNKKGISLRVPIINKAFCSTVSIQKFIQYIFDTIRKFEGDHILYQHYAEVLDIFDNLDPSKCVLADPITPRNVSTNVQQVQHVQYVNVYSSHQFLPTICTEFDLFLNGVVSMNETASIPLTVRFEVLQVDGNYFNRSWRAIGMDLEVHLNKSDSLEEIIANHMSNIQAAGYIIDCCLRVPDGYEYYEETEEIFPSDFSEYKPYYKFIRNHTNDFIVFRIKHNEEKKYNANICLPYHFN